MKTLLSLIILTISLIPLSAQESLTFSDVDSTTYSDYLKSDWDQIIEVGERAVEKDIDYYYLRMRIAYAFYMKTRYRKAIPHYLKALEFNSKDITALEYLYRCYLYGGRENDAEKLVSRFPETLKNYFKKRDSKIFTDIGFYATIGTGASESLKDEITQTAPNTIEGSQTLPNNFTNYNLNLSHRISRSILVHHSTNLLYKNSYSLAVVNSTPYVSESQIVRQFNYNLAIDFTPINGLSITPVFSYINYRIPIFYDYGSGSSRNREVYTYDTHQEFAVGLKAIKHLGIFDISLTGVHSDFNLSKQNTISTSISIYPFSNLNLYYTANGYLHFQNQNSNTVKQVIHSHKLGFKVIQHLWIEGSAILGDFTNLYDPFSGLTYNSQEQYNTITGVNFIIPLYKPDISIFVGYRYSQSESIFVPVDDVFETLNNKPINYQSITGGLTWKL